jgi:hypothetical protein
MRSVVPGNTVTGTRIEPLWNPGSSGGGWIPFEDCYPGPDYVAWTGFDFYNTGPGGWSGGWVAPSTMQQYHDRVYNLDPTKQQILCEIGCAEAPSGQSKAQWIADLVTYWKSNAPHILGAVWFDQPNSGGYNWSVKASTDPNVWPAWQAAVSDTLNQPLPRPPGY